MPAVARIGDAVSHGGSITGGSSNVRANGVGVARIGDPAFCAVHFVVTIVGGSTSVFANEQGVARVGDSLSCGATISSGSPDVFAGG